MFGFAPPALATRRSEQGAQECSTCRFESPLRENTTLRSLPNVEGRPGIFLQHLLQPQLIGGIQGALSIEAAVINSAMSRCLAIAMADHRPLRHGGIVLVPLKCAGILPDL